MSYFTKAFKWIFYTLLTAVAFCFVYFGSAEAAQKRPAFIADVAPNVQLVLFDNKGSCNKGLQAAFFDLERDHLILVCWDLETTFVVVTWKDGTRTAYHQDKFQLVQLADL